MKAVTCRLHQLESGPPGSNRYYVLTLARGANFQVVDQLDTISKHYARQEGIIGVIDVIVRRREQKD